LRSVILVLAVVSLPLSVRADDWLGVLPACSFAGRESLPSYEILYPRPGLPALVEAGTTLIARVRLPAPLTPPPGVQQPRALAGWQAELRGHALPLLAGGALEQRQALEVVNVRPDAAASLIYRASMPIPAWVAPGTYDFVLQAPGGQAVTRGAVRVLSRGQAPRLAFANADLPNAAAAALPVDVWMNVARDTQSTAEADLTSELAAAPRLEMRGLVVALRVGMELWVMGACRSADHTLESEVEGLLAREHRTRVTPRAPSLTAETWQPWGAGPRPWPAADALRFEPGENRLRISTASELPADAELSLLMPSDGRRTVIRGARLVFYPASEIGAAALPPVVARVLMSAGAQAVVERQAAPALGQPELRIEPTTLQSGAPVQLRLVGMDAEPRVAWRLDHARTELGPRTIKTTFWPLGEQPIVALAMTDDGRVARVQNRVRVRTAKASGCGSISGQRTTRPEHLACGLLLLPTIWARRRPGPAKKAPVRSARE
jgi:hypothetical protein